MDGPHRARLRPQRPQLQVSEFLLDEADVRQLKRASKNTTTPLTIAIMTTIIPLTIASKSVPIATRIYTVLDKVIMFWEYRFNTRDNDTHFVI
jgi:hypothetical protein